MTLELGTRVITPSNTPAVIVGWDTYWRMWRVRYDCGFEFCFDADELEPIKPLFTSILFRGDGKGGVTKTVREFYSMEDVVANTLNNVNQWKEAN